MRKEYLKDICEVKEIAEGYLRVTKYSIEDVGIGSYEYQGAPGVDRRLVYVVEDYEVIDWDGQAIDIPMEIKVEAVPF